jgi:8-oxo-dGTP pyrophosphatase MutT (NUDIX family)
VAFNIKNKEKKILFTKLIAVNNMDKPKFPFICNICYVINSRGEVLLQEKRRGFGQGFLNGPGGKIGPEEDIEASVRREVLEETTLRLGKLIPVGELEFIFTGREDINNYVYAFLSYEYEGEPKDTGEGVLDWFSIKDLPLDRMWPDDRYWLPQALRGEFVNYRFYFSADNKIRKYIDLAAVKK